MPENKSTPPGGGMNELSRRLKAALIPPTLYPQEQASERVMVSRSAPEIARIIDEVLGGGVE